MSKYIYVGDNPICFSTEKVLNELEKCIGCNHILECKSSFANEKFVWFDETILSDFERSMRRSEDAIIELGDLKKLAKRKESKERYERMIERERMSLASYNERCKTTHEKMKAEGITVRYRRVEE